MAETKYECVDCKKLMKRYAVLYRKRCFECRNLQLRIYYERDRMSNLSKKEFMREHRRLEAKIKGNLEEDNFDNDISEEDNSSDGDYISATPTNIRTSSIEKKRITDQEKIIHRQRRNWKKWEWGEWIWWWRWWRSW